MSLTMEFVPERIVVGGNYAFKWLVRGDSEALELLGDKSNRVNPEPIKHIFNCSTCPALIELKRLLAVEEPIVGKWSDEALKRWFREREEYADTKSGFELLNPRQKMEYDSREALLRVVGFCQAMNEIFNGNIVAESNCVS